MEEVLEKARKVADEAEVYYIQHRDEPVIFEANRVKLVERRESSGVALRIIKGGRIGLSSTTDLSALEDLVGNALELAPLGPKAHIQFPDYDRITPVEMYDPEVEKVSVEDMIHLGQTLIDHVREGYPDLVCDATVSKSTSTVTIINSRGAHVSYTKSVFSISAHGTLVKGTDMLFVSDSAASCHPIRDVSDLESAIRLQLEHSKDIVPAPGEDEEATVIFTPRGVVGALLSPLLAGLNGKAVLQKSSPLVGKLGERLVDQGFSLWDEPTLPYIPGSRTCDDEGVLTRKLPLIERGVITNFLYDLRTASRAGVKTTGSARRSLGSTPEPGASVVVVGEGLVPYQEMIGATKRGLVVERLLGAGQSNIQAGEFKANVLLGFAVKNGEIMGRVKDTVISGNVYQLLRSIEAMEDTSHWVGGSAKAPAIASLSVAVASKG